MKRVYILIFLVLLGLQSKAQHYFGLNFSGLTTYQIDNLSNTTSRFDGGVGFGVLYQLHIKGFLFQPGLSFDNSVYAQGIEDIMDFSVDTKDTEGRDVTYKVSVYDRIDRVNTVELSLPLMLGFKLSSVYALFGAKFICPLNTTTLQKALLTSSVDYDDMFYDDFMGLPSHGNASVQPIKTRGDANFSYDVRACVELGTILPLSKKNKYKKDLSSQVGIAAFAEYGLLDISKGGTNNLVDEKNLQYMSVEMNHIYTTFSSSSILVNNLRIGLRVSLLFLVSDVAERHRKCMCIDYVNRKKPMYRKKYRQL